MVQCIMKKYGGMEMDIKLVACDLDGTLLNDKGEVSKENLDAIKTLAKKGIYYKLVMAQQKAAFEKTR